MVDFYNQFKDFKSFEVIFTDDNKILQKLFCNIKRIENDKIILSANNEKNKNVFANIGNELKLHIYTDNGIYSMTSKVINFERTSTNTEYTITYPTNSKHSQRREYLRADIMVEFEMKIIKDDPASTETIISGATKNICGKGMSFVANAPMPSYKSISLTLNFEDKTVKTTADLVYLKQIVVENRPKFIHAFTFTKISQKNVDFIIQKCLQFQLDFKKNTK